MLSRVFFQTMLNPWSVVYDAENVKTFHNSLRRIPKEFKSKTFNFLKKNYKLAFVDFFRPVLEGLTIFCSGTLRHIRENNKALEKKDIITI